MEELSSGDGALDANEGKMLRSALARAEEPRGEGDGAPVGRSPADSGSPRRSVARQAGAGAGRLTPPESPGANGGSSRKGTSFPTSTDSRSSINPIGTGWVCLAVE